MRKSRPNPRVGIWWLVGKTLVAFTETLDRVQVVGGVRDSDLAHADIWPRVVGRYPKLRAKEYESIPRGRVLQHGEVFHILMPKSFAGDQKVIAKLLKRFQLQSHCYHVVADEHYDPPDEIEWDE